MAVPLYKTKPLSIPATNLSKESSEGFICLPGGLQAVHVALHTMMVAVAPRRSYLRAQAGRSGYIRGTYA